jgi:hypothetical protein
MALLSDAGWRVPQIAEQVVTPVHQRQQRLLAMQGRPALCLVYDALMAWHAADNVLGEQRNADFPVCRQ